MGSKDEDEDDDIVYGFRNQTYERAAPYRGADTRLESSMSRTSLHVYLGGDF